MAQEKHCEWGPSALARIAACPGSVHACHGLPDFKTDDATATGTRVHAAIAEIINSKDNNFRHLDLDHLEREVEKINLSAEEQRMVCECVQFLQGYLTKLDDEGADILSVRAEVRLEVNSFSELLYWGTCDVLIEYIKDKDYRSSIIDWKTGGREVALAEFNLQGAAYALAAMMHKLSNFCRMLFYNPRLHTLSETSFDDWQGLLQTISGVIEAAKSEDAPLHDGEQCRYCRAQQWGACPLLEGRRASAMARGALEEETLDEMEPAEIARRLDELTVLADQKASLEKWLKSKVSESPWGGWRIEKSFAGAEITDPAAAFGAVKDVLDGDYFLSLGKFTQRKVADAYAEAAKQCGLVKTKKEGAEIAKAKLKDCSKEIYKEMLVKENKQ